MLLDMKARVEGIRALALKLCNHQDRVHALHGKDDAAVLVDFGPQQLRILLPCAKLTKL